MIRSGLARGLSTSIADTTRPPSSPLPPHPALNPGLHGLAQAGMVLVNGYTIFALVDALTRLSGEITFAGDRTEADAKASSLLALVA